MKNICKIAVLLAVVLMLFCVTGCGDNAGGTPSSGTQPQTQTPSGGTQTQTPSGGTQTQTPAEPPFVARVTPLTLEAINAGTITLSNPGCMTNLRYRKNGGNFVSVTADANTITVAAGDKIAFYADDSLNQTGSYFHIVCDHDCYVYGNVMSLLSSSSFADVNSVPQRAFYGLFFGNTNIKNHPSKTLVLPATTLANNCYGAMFYGCTGLTSAPVLPATTLADYCYYTMFFGCTGLTSAPALPATTLVSNCYNAMFSGCSSLNSVTCLATNISTSGYTTNWLNGVASTGTFTKPSSMTSWSTGVSGIPSGWDIQPYSAQ